MAKLTAYILTFNEAEKIKAAVESVLWTDEIVVADSGSTDATAAIATGLGARVVQIPFKGFGDLRNRASVCSASVSSGGIGLFTARLSLGHRTHACAAPIDNRPVRL